MDRVIMLIGVKPNSNAILHQPIYSEPNNGVNSKTGKCPAPFIEVMACEGGCITGPATYSGDKGKRMMIQNLAKWKDTY